MLRKATVLLWALCLILVFTACNQEGNGSDGAMNETPTTSETPVGMPESDLSFDLSREEDPNFTDNEQDTTLNTEEPEPLYIIIDGYAYQLDPATLLPIDIPLDPVTHEPVEIDPEEDSNTEVEEHPSAEEPTDDTKYPNTGVFTEDD